MQHRKIQIQSDSGELVSGQAPIIVSASRATDIPAFYAEWFFDRLEKGHVVWQNPFSGQSSFISFAETRFIVFWSKNPAPLMPYLYRLREKGVGTYIQYTLNDYISENLEPNLPPLEDRIATFKKLVEILGPKSVVWRYDPLILTDNVTIDSLLDRIAYISDMLVGYADKLVFSYADISTYKKVVRNLRASGVDYREWNYQSV